MNNRYWILWVSLIIPFLSVCAEAEQHYTLPTDVVVFDVWAFFDEAKIDTIQERANAMYFITSLQGLANRHKPRLYLDASLALFDVETRHYYDPDYRNKPVGELDKFWLNYFQEQGYFKGVKLTKTSQLEELIAEFGSAADGLVLWTMDVPATSNIALMAAGCESLLPISKDIDSGKFYARVKQAMPSLKVMLDLTDKFDGKSSVIVDGKSFASTLSAKNDCYLYIIEKYVRTGLANPYKMWYNCDASMWGKFRCNYDEKNYGYLGDRNELQHNGMYNPDYWVSQKAIFFDLFPWADVTPCDDPDQVIGTDNRTWHDLLETTYHLRNGEFAIGGGFVPWWIKYTSHTGSKYDPVPTEWEFVSLLSSYNIGNDADAAFGLANASFYQHLPHVSVEDAQFSEPEKIAYDPNSVYISFLMLDYDGSAWINQMIPTIYDDPARGQLPLNWCVNPALNLRVPHAIHYLYAHKTNNDFFGFSSNGAAYVQLNSSIDRKGRIKETGAAYYIRFAEKLNQRYGVKYTPFYIEDHFNDEWASLAAQTSPFGFGTNLPIQEKLIGNTPVNYVESFHVSSVPDLQKRIDEIYYNNLKSDQYRAKFYAFRCILMKPSMVFQAVKKAEKKYPQANIQIVDVANFYTLLKHKLTTPFTTPYSQRASVNCAPENSNGLKRIDVSDGSVEVVNKNGFPSWKIYLANKVGYLYFAADEGFRENLSCKLMIEIEYFDDVQGQLLLEYNSNDESATLGGAYKLHSTTVTLSGTKEWKSARFAIADALFSGRQNGQSDFRFVNLLSTPITIRSVSVHRDN